MATEDVRLAHPLTRVLWLIAGLVNVGLGALGVIVPGLPTTGFFILAAWCFSKSNPRLERWVLGLPGVGQMVLDHRAGLGMPRRAKAWAIAMMLAAGGASVWLVLRHPLVRVVVIVALAVGVWWVGFHIPTRERVLAERARQA